MKQGWAITNEKTKVHAPIDEDAIDKTNALKSPRTEPPAPSKSYIV
jgi:hypothetical protein